ncbi:MAG: type II toxin-antitoxin system RelE/ParE family toxin [Deltaproteobacteria bacterium]|nr:type II toxin-antitoxin system RelE/ParE family toxin [Deltaproteobacteria bacterium]
MSYSVHVKKSAEKEIRSLPIRIRESVVQALIDLESDPTPKGRCRALRSPLNGFRIRIGDWRILYTIDDVTREVMVFSVSHRREAYR